MYVLFLHGSSLTTHRNSFGRCARPGTRRGTPTCRRAKGPEGERHQAAISWRQRKNPESSMVGCGLNTCPSVLQKYGQKKTMYSFGILWVSRLSCLVYRGPVRPPRSSSFVASTPGLQIPSQKVLRRNPPKRVHCYRSRGDLWSGKAWRCSPRRKGNNAHVHRNTRRLPVQRLWPSPKGLQHGGSVEFIICQPLYIVLQSSLKTQDKPLRSTRFVKYLPSWGSAAKRALRHGIFFHALLLFASVQSIALWSTDGLHSTLL